MDTKINNYHFDVTIFISFLNLRQVCLEHRHIEDASQYIVIVYTLPIFYTIYIYSVCVSK